MPGEQTTLVRGKEHTRWFWAPSTRRSTPEESERRGPGSWKYDRKQGRPSVCDVALTKPQRPVSPELSAITACSLQHVQAVLLPVHQCTNRNTLPGSDAASMVRVTPGLYACDSLLPLERPDQLRTHAEKPS